MERNGLAIEFAKGIMKNENDNCFESDFKIIYPENDLIKVEEIRKIINEIYIKPVYAKKKIVIIDDADKMNINAQNALLKVLEEPPLYAIIILIVAHKEKIIKTILSRVTEITFDSLKKEELEQIVDGDIDLDYAMGSASKALELLQGDCYKTSFDLAKEIEKKDFLTLNRKFKEVKEKEEDILKILEMLKLIYHKDLKEDTYNKVKKIEIIEETIKNINRNANVDLALDKMMIKICD